MEAREYRVERVIVGFVNVTSDDIIEAGENVEDEKAWLDAASEMINEFDFEVVDEEVYFEGPLL